MGPNKERCGNCKWWEPSRDNSGICRFHAPTPQISAVLRGKSEYVLVWPTTTKDEWCKEGFDEYISESADKVEK